MAKVRAFGRYLWELFVSAVESHTSLAERTAWILFILTPIGLVLRWAYLTFASVQHHVADWEIVAWFGSIAGLIGMMFWHSFARFQNEEDKIEKIRSERDGLVVELKTVRARNEDLLHQSVIGRSPTDPHEWPALTDEQIEQWVNELRPFALKALKITTLPSVEIMSFFRSIKKIGKELKIEPQLVTAGYPPKAGEFRIQAVTDDPAALKLLDLCKAYTPLASITFLKMSPDYRGDLDIFIGEKPDITPVIPPIKLRVEINPERPFAAAQWQSGPAIFFRVDVTSLILEPITNCRASLVKISRNGERKWGDAKATLTFEPGESVDSKRKNIAPRGTEILDIFLQHGGAIYPATWPRTAWPYPTPLHTIFEEIGHYELAIVIEADNVPADTFIYKFTRDRAYIGEMGLSRMVPIPPGRQVERS